MSNTLSYMKRRLSQKKDINDLNYKIIEDFTYVTYDECLKYDYENQKIYKKIQNKLKKIHKTINSTNINIDLKIPELPHISNAERYKLWKRRNTYIHPVLLAEAVLFLNENDLILNVHYEAFQAIELSKYLKKKT